MISMPFEPITSDRLAKPVGPFSPAVRDGDRVYTSGQVAQDPSTGKLIEGSVAAQTEQIFNNLKVILEAADKTLADVVKHYDQVLALGLSAQDQSDLVEFLKTL